MFGREWSDLPDGDIEDECLETNESTRANQPTGHLANTPLELLTRLLSRTGRPPAPNATIASVRIRVIRKTPPGFAVRTAQLFEAIIENVNKVHGLDLSPLTLHNILERMEEGTTILSEIKNSKETRVLAQAAVSMTHGAGRAMYVLGVLCCVCCVCVVCVKFGSLV